MGFSQRILWVDWIGATVVGLATLFLRVWLSELGGLPLQVVVSVGIANLLYAAYSLSLCILLTPSMRLIKALVLANLAWSLICIALLVASWSVATGPGVVHLGGEALYVGILALVEWRNRERLARVRVHRIGGSDDLRRLIPRPMRTAE